MTAGYIVTTIPYAFGVFGALAANFKNATGWLVVPIVGPWLTIGQRSYTCSDQPNQTAKQGLQCAGEIFALMGLIMDGVMQATGGTLLLIGYTSTRPELAPNGHSFRLSPISVGSGYGVGAVGVF